MIGRHYLQFFNEFLIITFVLITLSFPIFTDMQKKCWPEIEAPFFARAAAMLPSLRKGACHQSRFYFLYVRIGYAKHIFLSVLSSKNVNNAIPILDA